MTEKLPNWNLKDFYSSYEDPQIQKDTNTFKEFVSSFSKKYSGKILNFSDGFDAVISEFEDGCEISAKLECYAFLIYATNMNDSKIVQFYQKISEEITEISGDLIFFTNSINNFDKSDFDKILTNTIKYKSWLINIRRFSEHQLNEEGERILLDKSMTANSSWVRFFEEKINDLKFLIDDKELNSSEALNLLTDQDSLVRKKAALSIGDVFKNNVKTFTFITNTLAKDKIINDKWRNYQKPVDARNLANNIEGDVVDALSNSVQNHYSKISHRYYKLKSKIFDKEKLDFWDRNAPYPEASNKKISWKEAEDIVLKSYGDFDKQLEEIAQLFFDKNWIDAELKQGKSPGAFSASTIPSIHPYILMNYHGKTRDVMTLAHELGHGCHQYLSAKQGMLLASTPLTLSETASVFGEMMTFRNLLERCDKSQKKYLLASKIEDMINTVIRQISFFEFEKLLHTERKIGELSSEKICEIWMETQSRSLGPNIELSEDYKYFWTYIPHFIHTPFYVYAYAFGDCLVNVLIQLFDENHPNFKQLYLDLLKSGGSKHYSEVLSPFNIDLKDNKSWDKGLSLITGLIDEFENTL
ncbi:M3 family oligoendopeptidase [Alphaproteobacteria bacterium]|nr:M3 family oligoendopeptidase [Alphaproteobacteria bacterium]